MSTSPLFRIQQTPKTGQGIIDLTVNPAGTLILAENPLIDMPRVSDDLSWARRAMNILDAAETLPREDMEAFFDLKTDNADLKDGWRFAFYHLLANSKEEDPEFFNLIMTMNPVEREEAAQCFVAANLVFACNSKELDRSGWEYDTAGGEDRFVGDGLFVTSARFNHSCIPNAHASWNGSTKRLTVYAKRDIAAGEEICVSYRGVEFSVLGRAERQRVLKRECGFVCLCNECDEAEQKHSDIVRAVAMSLAMRWEGVPDEEGERKRVVEDLEKAVKELRKLDIMGVATAEIHMAEVYLAEEDLAKVQEHYLEACRIYTTCLGKENPFTLAVVKKLLTHGKESRAREPLITEIGFEEEALKALERQG